MVLSVVMAVRFVAQRLHAGEPQFRGALAAPVRDCSAESARGPAQPQAFLPVQPVQEASLYE